MIAKNIIFVMVIPLLIHAEDQQIDYYAPSFSKLLNHCPITGLLTPTGRENYRQLQTALKSGKQADFNAINRPKGVQRLWANPQSAFARVSTTITPDKVTVAPPPALSSTQAAADLIELYLMAACRDVIFADYGTGKRTDADGKGGSLTNTAARILTNLASAYQGPKKGKAVDGARLFRGNCYGDLIGPYLSQFLLQPYYPLFPTAPTDVGVNNFSKDIFMNRRYIPILQQREFGLVWEDFVALQNGFIPQKFEARDCNKNMMRHISNGRDLACFVYTDVAYDAYYYAIHVLYCNEFPYSKAFPYAQTIKNESAGNTMGLNDVYSLIAQVCMYAYQICWHYKWCAFNRLRPEAMAGLLHQAITSGNNRFNLDKSLFDKELLSLIMTHNQKQSDKNIVSQPLAKEHVSTHLLAQIYPDASPTHPSFPAAHATIAGACTTILKAMFDDTVLLSSRLKISIPDPSDPQKLQPYTCTDAKHMTVGSELDKLASNIAYGRSWAGIHFRSDNQAGLKLGEDVAILVLQQHAKIYAESGFKGFEFTKRDGTRIKVGK